MKLGVLVYLEIDGKVLMIHRQKEDEHQHLWLAPGGKVEKNEAPVVAAIREYEEETGLHIYPANMQLKAVLTFPDEGDSPFGDEWNVFVFHVREYSGELIENCPEGTLEWVPKTELLQLPMWEGDQLFTPRIFDPPFFMARLHYKSKKLVSSQFWTEDS